MFLTVFSGPETVVLDQTMPVINISCWRPIYCIQAGINDIISHVFHSKHLPPIYVHYTPIFFNGLLTILLHKQFGSTFKSLEYEKIVFTISHQNSLKYFTKRCLSIFVVKLSLIFLYMKKPKLGNFVLRSGSGPHEKWDCAKKVGIRILVFKSHS